MSRFHRPFYLICLLLLFACDNREINPPFPPPPSPTATLDPQAVVLAAGETMSELQSVRFDIRRGGGPAFVDSEQTLIFNQAVGRYGAPDKAIAALDLSGPGVNIKIDTIAIGDEQWITNFVNQQWEKLPPEWGFNPADIFNDQIGWRPLLNQNLVDISKVRSDTLDGTRFHVVDITVEGARVRAITAGAAVSDQPVMMTLWIEQSTNLVHQITFSTPPHAGDLLSEWDLRFSKFNEAVTIEAPVTGNQ